MTTRQSLKIWTIYYNPADYPGQYVVRAYETFGVRGEPVAASACTVHDTLTQARAFIPSGLFNLGREERDEAQIVESWI